MNNLSGVITKKYDVRKTSTGKNVTDFILQTKEGEEVKCSYWDKWDDSVRGPEVSFAAKETGEYKGVKQYSVRGKIMVHGEAPAKSPEPESKVEMTHTSAVSTFVPAPKKDREEFRAQAEECVIQNLKSAQKVAEALTIKATPSNLIELGDMIGRTLTAVSLEHKRG